MVDAHPGSDDGPFPISGAIGRRAKELLALQLDAQDPTRTELGVTNAATVGGYLRAHGPAKVIHAAACTDLPGAERQAEACWRLTVLGPHHVADGFAQPGATLVPVPTDCGFWVSAEQARAARGGYREDDPTGPVRNRYALSKLAAEDDRRCGTRSYAPSPGPANGPTRRDSPTCLPAGRTSASRLSRSRWWRATLTAWSTPKYACRTWWGRRRQCSNSVAGADQACAPQSRPGPVSHYQTTWC